jgi:putative ABC transport system ATP-binding protein
MKAKPFMIKLENVNKSYFLGDTKVHAVKNINLSIKDKEFIGILGTSGSGKSTLMHLIGLLENPTSGKVYLDGKDISKLEDHELSRIRNKSVGFVFQSFNLINRYTVLENVILPTQYSTEPLPYDPIAKADDLLKKFGIYERRNFYPNKISGGQQQRVAIARALIMSPKLVLADEPTGNLDSKTGDEIIAILKNLNKDFGVTVVLVTHEHDIAAKTKRQIFIKDGEIAQKYL